MATAVTGVLAVLEVPAGFSVLLLAGTGFDGLLASLCAVAVEGALACAGFSAAGAGPEGLLPLLFPLFFSTMESGCCDGLDAAGVEAEEVE